jgi:hypothetical protein
LATSPGLEDREPLPANSFKRAFESNADLNGLVTVYPDNTTLDSLIFHATLECAVAMAFGDAEVAMVVSIKGYYYVNHDVFS